MNRVILLANQMRKRSAAGRRRIVRLLAFGILVAGAVAAVSSYWQAPAFERAWAQGAANSSGDELRDQSEGTPEAEPPALTETAIPPAPTESVESLSPTPEVSPTATATAEPLSSPQPGDGNENEAETTPDPTADASPAASPEAELSEIRDPIEITASSFDGEARPGKTAKYRFRLTNTTEHPLLIRVTVTDSAEGWTSTVYAADGVTEITADVLIDAGESLDLIVSVTPPTLARPGDQNVTSFDAQPVTEGDSGTS
jgi:hypothetical protein